MANEEHIKILKQVVEAWNKWRQDNPDTKPDLGGANLVRVDLSEANLSPGAGLPVIEGDRERISSESFSRLFLAFEETDQSKIFPNEAFGYWKVTVERPLRLKDIDPNRAYTPKEIKALRETAERADDAPPVIRKIHKKSTAPAPLRGLFAAIIDGRPAIVEYEPDTALRHTEQVPLLEEEGGIEAFPRREVLPYTPDAWIKEGATKIGYEVSLTRHSYKPQPLRTLEEISADILVIEKEAEGLLDGLLKGAAK